MVDAKRNSKRVLSILNGLSLRSQGGIFLEGNEKNQNFSHRGMVFLENRSRGRKSAPKTTEKFNDKREEIFKKGRIR